MVLLVSPYSLAAMPLIQSSLISNIVHLVFFQSWGIKRDFQNVVNLEEMLTILLIYYFTKKYLLFYLEMLTILLGLKG